MSGVRAWLAVVVAGLPGGCGTVAYEPATVTVGAIDAARFADVVDIAVRPLYPRLALYEPANLRLQSEWLPASERDRAARRRLTMWVEERALHVVVAVRYLELGFGGESAWWTEPRGHWVWEGEVVRRVQETLENV